MTSTAEQTLGTRAPSFAVPIGMPPGEAEADQIADLLRALADQARRQLVSIVRATRMDEVCPCDLTRCLARRQHTISYHPFQLVEAGVSTDQRGKRAWIRVRPERLDTASPTLEVV